MIHKLLEYLVDVTIEFLLASHLLVPPGCEGEDVGWAALSTLLAAGLYSQSRATSWVSVLAGDRGKGLLPAAEPACCG